MNRSFGFLVTALMALVVSSYDSHVLAQTVPREVQPCIEDGAPGRPTLKRRQPAPDSGSTNGGSNGSKLEATERCPPKDPAADLVNEELQRSAAEPLKEQNLVSVQFEGMHAFAESDVLKMFRERGALPRDRMPDSEAIDKAIAPLKELFQDRGYDYAQFDVVKDEKLNSITVFVNEGMRLSITEIRFEGNRVFPSQQLTAKIQECLIDYEEASQGGYDRLVFEACQHQLANFMRSRGYLQATLGEPKRTVNGNSLFLTIPIEEGILYRIGEIKIEGEDGQAMQQLMSGLELRRGDIANGEKIGKWLFEDLKALYNERGFIEYTADVNPTFNDNPQTPGEGIVDFDVTIYEGKRFRLVSIKFDGGDLPEQELRDLFLIREGDVFNQKLFEESVNKLNDTGLFYFIDKDKDCDFRTDDEAVTVLIVIKLQRRDNRQPPKN